MLWSEHPSWSYLRVINQVESTVTKVAGLKGEVTTGGIVNAAAALGSVSESSTSPANSTATHVVSSSARGPSLGVLSTIQVTFNAGVSPSSLTAADLGLIGPAGHIAVTGVSVVSGTGDRTFNISFPKQTTPGAYVLYVGPSAKDLEGNAIAAYNTKFTLVTPPPPAQVVSATASGPSQHSLSAIQVTFSKSVSPSTFSADDVGLIGPPGHVACTGVAVVAGSNDCTFTISFATQSKPGTYTLYLGTKAKDLAGTPIAAYSKSFKLAAAPVPTHVVTSSSSGPSQYALSRIQVTFNAGVEPTTFAADDVGLIGPAGHVAITGVAVVSGSNDSTFTITFATQSKPGTYTLYVGTKAKDLAGNAIGSYSTSFKLAAAPVPTHVVSSSASGPSKYSLSSIQVTFNTGVDPSTFAADDVGLIGPTGHVAITGVAVVSGSNDCTFTINFATQSAPGTYTLYVGTKAEDLAGNAIGSHSTSFKLVAAPVPTHVVSSSASGPSKYTLSSIQVTFNAGVEPATFAADNVGLIGPAGHVAITGVTVVPGSNDRTFTIRFASQSKPGVYTLYLGSKTKDVAGNAIGSYQTSFNLAAPPAPSVTSFTSANSLTIKPGTTVVSKLAIGQNLTISHIAVQLNIQYPQDGDLEVTLQAPDGTQIVLAQWMGGSTANFPNTTFDDNASQSIAFAAGPYTGSYQPLTALSYLNGKNTQGTWTLWVQNRGTSTGTLTNWMLKVKGS